MVRVTTKNTCCTAAHTSDLARYHTSTARTCTYLDRDVERTDEGLVDGTKRERCAETTQSLLQSDPLANMYVAHRQAQPGADAQRPQVHQAI
jgi:hypothetical protein